MYEMYVCTPSPACNMPGKHRAYGDPYLGDNSGPW